LTTGITDAGVPVNTGPLSGLGGTGLLMGMSMWGIIASLAFSLLGYLYVKWGRSRNDVTEIVCGVLLMLYPYFVTKTLYIVGAGLVIAAAPYVLGNF
jgi:hypothetical protein